MSQEITRYVRVFAVLDENKNIIPIWDPSLNFVKSDEYCLAHLTMGSTYFSEKFYNLIECIYDLKSKSLSLGIELDIYPKIDTLDYKPSEYILYEVGNRSYSEATIDKVIFEEYDVNIVKGEDFSNRLIPYLKDGIVDLKAIYTIKYWKPTWILNNGIKIKYNHQLARKV